MAKKIRVIILILLFVFSLTSCKKGKIYSYLDNLDFKDTTSINLEEVLETPIDSFYVFGEFSFAKRKPGFSLVESIGDIIGMDYNGTDVLYHKNRIIVVYNHEIVHEETWDNHSEILVGFRGNKSYKNKNLHVEKGDAIDYYLDPYDLEDD